MCERVQRQAGGRGVRGGRQRALQVLQVQVENRQLSQAAGARKLPAPTEGALCSVRGEIGLQSRLGAVQHLLSSQQHRLRHLRGVQGENFKSQEARGAAALGRRLPRCEAASDETRFDEGSGDRHGQLDQERGQFHRVERC